MKVPEFRIKIMQDVSNRKTTTIILVIMVIGIVSVIALSMVTGRYTASTKADNAIFRAFGK